MSCRSSLVNIPLRNLRKRITERVLSELYAVCIGWVLLFRLHSKIISVCPFRDLCGVLSISCHSESKFAISAHTHRELTLLDCFNPSSPLVVIILLIHRRQKKIKKTCDIRGFYIFVTTRVSVCCELDFLIWILPLHHISVEYRWQNRKRERVVAEGERRPIKQPQPCESFIRVEICNTTKLTDIPLRFLQKRGP